MKVLTFLNYLRGIFKTTLESGTAHHAIIQSIYDMFIVVNDDIDLMRLEMCLSTASGKWLDYWGDFFSVHRKLNEEDKPYAKRIIEYVIRPKTTIPAIKEYIVDFLNEEYNTEYTTKDVSIKEPWRELGKLSHQGRLSHDARFYSRDYWCHAVLDVSIPEKLTQDLIDLVLSVKAAGVKIVWSFLNAYDIIQGFNDVEEPVADYHRHIQMMVPRITYSGLILSNSSLAPTLSGRRELWFWMTNQYYMYAKMWNKDTDKSEVITAMDLAGLLDYYDIIEEVFTPKDTGSKLSQNSKLDGLMKLSGAKTEAEAVTKIFEITEDMLKSIQMMDEWLTLSQSGKLSDDGKLFQSNAPYELLSKIMDNINRWKETNREYYDSLQPPIVNAEHIAMWYAARHKNWLFDTPTMSQDDFYELWEIDDDNEHHTFEDITRFEDMTHDKYLTMGDPYQPPIVIAGSPWDWTPIMDNPWLWSSATLTNEELEEIYRTKFSGFPDLVTIETFVTTHPEKSFTLSGTGVLSPQQYIAHTSQVRSPEASMVLSSSKGQLNVQHLSGKAVETIVEYEENPEFTGFTYLSGSESVVTKRKTVQENVPTLEKLIEFEENQVENGQVWNPNEDINYSTRDWFQAPVQIGIYAMWLIVAHERQLWNAKSITNDEIMSYWDSPDGTADVEAVPEYFVKSHMSDSIIYQPPIVTADHPFYWTNKHDKPWLWNSATLTNEDLEQIYLKKFGDSPEVFPDLVTVVDVVNKTPEKAFRLSDNAYMNDNHVQVTEERITHPGTEFKLSVSTLSGNQMMSGMETEIITTQELILDGHGEHYLSGDKTTYSQRVEVLEHTPTLGRLIELEEQQDEVQYSTRDLLQSFIIVAEGIAQWYVLPNERQLWNTPIIDNREILNFWEGEGKPYTTTKLGQMLMADTVKYQMPLIISEGGFDQWSVKVDYTQLWNTPTMDNDEILSLWVGDDVPTAEEFEAEHLHGRRLYQPPIVMSDHPFYWLNDHTLYDADWLWNSATLTCQDLEVVYSERYGTSVTLGKLIELEESVDPPYSHRGRCQAPLSIVENHIIQLNANVIDQPWLWNSMLLTNNDLEGHYESQFGQPNPTLEQLLTSEETLNPDAPYSTRGNTQTPIQVDSN